MEILAGRGSEKTKPIKANLIFFGGFLQSMVGEKRKIVRGTPTDLPDEEFFSCVAGEFVVNHKILKKRKNNPKLIIAVLD